MRTVIYSAIIGAILGSSFVYITLEDGFAYPYSWGLVDGWVFRKIFTNTNTIWNNLSLFLHDISDIILIPTITPLRQEKQDLYGQILIYTYYYLNCRNVLMDDECDNRESRGTFSMREFLINAIIIFTLGLFATVPVMILLWALGLVQLWKILNGQ